MRTYRTRNPRNSPLWQCAQRHRATFVACYSDTYEPKYGPLRPVVEEVLEKFIHCGTLERGFARVRCDHCEHEYLLAFSCKGRWFCPSCHQRKVQSTAANLVDHVLLPVDHRHYVLALPKLLRPTFYRNRSLLKRLCTIAQQTITAALRAALDLPKGRPAFFLTLHTYGEYLDFHPHIHALGADGLLDDDGTWHPAPEIPHRVLEELFRTKIFAELLHHKLISPELVARMKSWKHTGFNVDASRTVAPENRAEREQLCQYVLRNPFSVEKITLESPTDTVIYRSKLNPKINRNFEIFDPVDFLAVLSQHIPDKGVQMIRYYGLYSNKMRGCARKGTGHGRSGGHLKSQFTELKSLPPGSPPPPRKLPSRKWRDLIRQAWHVDPLQCPVCQKQMRVIAFLDNPEVVEKILRHMNLWCGPAAFAPARPPPPASGMESPEPEFNMGYDVMPDYENVITD